MNRKKVAILGATGAVGQEMLKAMVDKQLAIDIIQLASKNSEGRIIEYSEKKWIIQEATSDSFKGVDYVLGAVSNELAIKFAPIIKQNSAIFIDNSSAFRMQTEVPLIIPEINATDVQWHNGVIANPNCSTIITLMAVYGLHQVNPIKRMIVSTYQAVSGAGKQGIDELLNQEAGNKQSDLSVFDYPIFHNLIPKIGQSTETGSTSEELKMLNESIKILHHENLLVSCTCVRVPVIRCHSVSVNLEFQQPLSASEAKVILQKTSGVALLDDLNNNIYPMPFNTSEQDIIHVGRVRNDASIEDNKGLILWACGDQLRKGAATNAVQILELLLKTN